MSERELFIPKLDREKELERKPREDIKEELSQREIIEKEITEEEVDKSIKESPESFVNWFDNLKNSLSEKFYKSKALRNPRIRNALIYAYIPFALLMASGVKAETQGDVISEFVHQPKIYERERKRHVPQIKPEELVALEIGKQKKILAKRINTELSLLDKLSKPFNKAVDKKVFDFAGRAYLKIEESNSYFKEISELTDPRKKQEKRKKRLRKIFEDGRLNFKELTRSFGEALGALQLSILIHEIGHKTEAMEQGAESTDIKIGLFSGHARYRGKIENKAAFDAAGINASKRFGEFLVDNLRKSDRPSQLLALAALVAKSNGMFYSMKSSLGYGRDKGDDIINYAEETNTPLSQLTLGLAADFIFDRDNWGLVKIALGKEGLKIPKYTIGPMYELGEEAPIIGIKFKGVF
jgi:hypothetical protein